MGKLVPQLISILTPNPKKKERHDFTHKVKEEVIRRQKESVLIVIDGNVTLIIRI
jgi:hypothetical protein